ncbi:hypothetical protein ABD76_26175 [Paenibacillus dendritiformis]|uniref:hypothetical protein n=1 Tax=Paenibacillus dendritiformis TaxID=130049 RepID=UPI0018CE3FBE|nr:hypothetical protein [Paenibacillus dendritiformis]MBG9795754.1 hypothetical protein [Paenibacillus dendritiformis]
MNVKKAILASMIVSSMLVTLAGPIPAGAEAAQEKPQEQQQSKSKEVQIDKKMAAELQKAVKQFAGKEIKLKDVGELDEMVGWVWVHSEDETYSVAYIQKTKKIWHIRGKQSIDRISKKDQDEILKVLKGMHAKKKYTFDKEVNVTEYYENPKEPFTHYSLSGKDFSAFLLKNMPGSTEKTRIGAAIEFSKKELEPKLLKTAAEAVKTALDRDLDVTKAVLEGNVENKTWKLKGGKVTLSMDGKTGKVHYVYDGGRKQVLKKDITEKEAKEAVAPIAKKLFNMDLQGLEVKWDNSARDFIFVQNKETKMVAALDADKNVVYLMHGERAYIQELHEE